MKKLISNTIFILVVIFFSSCSSKSEYTDAIPQDASMVISLNMKKIVDKSGINEENSKALVRRITDALKSGLGAKSNKAVEELLKDPSSSGISFEDNIYLFSGDSSNLFGILAKLDDEDDFSSILEVLNEEGVCSEIHDGDKCQWAKIGNLFCGFNNGTLMIISNGTDDTSGLKETLMSYMRQEKDKSFSSTSYFKKLNEAKGEMAVILNFSLLPSNLVSQLKIGMPADMKLEDLKYLMNVDFNAGNISCQVQSLISEASIVSTLEDIDKATMNVDNDLLAYYPSNTVLWSGASIKGGEFYSILSKNPAVERMMDDPMIPIDINDIFSAVDGDVALGYINPSLDDMILYGKVKTDQFMSGFDELIPLVAMSGGQMTLKKTGKATYQFGAMGENLWFGVKNGMLYVTNNASLANMACQKYPNSLLNTKAASSTANSRFVTFINAQQIVSQMTMMSDYNLKMMQPVLNYCDYATINVPDRNSAKMDVFLKDKSVNVLQLLVRELQ